MTDINNESLKQIISDSNNDDELKVLVYDCLESFEAYHKSIYSMEIRLALFKSKDMETDEYQEMYTGLDKARRNCHNAVIRNINILNRLAEKATLAPVYDGVVSEEKPYRREVANAVLAYVETVIKERR